MSASSPKSAANGPTSILIFASGDERESAIQYVYQRYGKLGAAMTANVITYRGRSAARDIGKVLGFDEEMLGRLSKVVPHWGFQDKRTPRSANSSRPAWILREPLVQKFLSLYERVQDLPRHLGQHSGGMVICQGQLDSIVPLQPATMPGRFVVQWDKEDCADMGIVKVDLLGLGMMAVMKESIGLIREHYGEKWTWRICRENDPQVYAALQKADTIGMFQVESRAQMSFLPSLQPKHFYDIVVQVAIIRPGPIVGKMLHPYLRRRQGLEAVSYPHPALRAGAEAHARSAVISRTAAAHGDDRRRIHRRTGRRIAPRDGISSAPKNACGRLKASCATGCRATALQRKCRI